VTPALGPRLVERGAELGVWAPYVSSLAVRLGDRTVPLERGDRGVWRGLVEGAAAGDDYLLVLDGERVRPDPRSRFPP
jgi:maltooligosyltrehalose trehalohydrolase